jgi:ectoine hydroxylase-related dioxygenase (phytanoyl-CoA dioxygenase family)
MTTQPTEKATILSCWIAVTDATVENGCLQVIPGSHRRDLIDHCPTGHDLGIRIASSPSPINRWDADAPSCA